MIVNSGTNLREESKNWKELRKDSKVSKMLSQSTKKNMNVSKTNLKDSTLFTQKSSQTSTISNTSSTCTTLRMLREEPNKLMSLINSKVSRRKLKKRRSSMMIERMKTKCFNRIRCVKHKMVLVRNNGNLAMNKQLVDSNPKMMTNLEMMKVWTMMKIAMMRISSRKRMKMTNKAITTFEGTMSDIYLTYSHLLVILNFFT